MIATFGWHNLWRILGFEELTAKKEMTMTNAILASEVNLTSSELLSSKSIGRKGKGSSANAVRTLRVHKAAGRRTEGRTVAQTLLGRLLDPKSSSQSLAALARAAAFSGKRLVLEIRDENPVKIIRMSTREM